MVEKELEIFKDCLSLREEELTELDGALHTQLLERAFTELTGELDSKGNTLRFDDLRKEHAAKILKFWRAKIQIYNLAVANGQIAKGQELIRGEERLRVSLLGVYENDDEQVLHIQRRTNTEEDEVSITADQFTGIDEFLHPPMIKSKIWTDPDESPDIYYKLILRSNAFSRGSAFRISTFEKAVIREDPEGQRHYVKDIRVIDCSSFGVEGSLS